MIRQQRITNFFLKSSSTLDENSQFSTMTTSLQTNSMQDDDEYGGFTNIMYLPIYYQNVRSIPAKTNLRSRISQSLYKVLCFTESWLTSYHDNDCYFPNEFNVYRCDRNTNGGGVALLVHQQFKSEQIEKIFDVDCESICVKIELKPVPLVIYAAYINKPDRNIMMKHFSLVQQVVSMEKQSRVLILGDFNLHELFGTWMKVTHITFHKTLRHIQNPNTFKLHQTF